jgi:hypothetical protein
MATNPHMRYADSKHNGLAIIEVRGDALDVDFISVDDVKAKKGGVAGQVSFTTPSGSRRVLPA